MAREKRAKNLEEMGKRRGSKSGARPARSAEATSEEARRLDLRKELESRAARLQSAASSLEKQRNSPNSTHARSDTGDSHSVDYRRLLHPISDRGKQKTKTHQETLGRREGDREGGAEETRQRRSSSSGSSSSGGSHSRGRGFSGSTSSHELEFDSETHF